MTSLTAIFGNSDEKPQEDSEKLLQLYWNRAELKKEFADLRNEKFRLQERVKQQEGATARVHQKLNHLEQLLLDPEWVYNVIIHYQLQHLNRRCESKLAKFAEQLKQQREQKQHGQLLEDWKAQCVEEAGGIEAEIGEQRIQVQMLEDRLQAEQNRLITMSGFVRFFRKRSITSELDKLAASLDEAHQAEEHLMARYEEIQNRQPPDTQGLDIPTKRIINFMILSFAQQMYLHFNVGGLVGLAKEAGDKSVGSVKYGGKRECDKILERVGKAMKSFEKSRDFADVLQQRAKLIAKTAVFNSDSDAVPASGSVSTVFEITERGVIKERDANLLGQDYWGLSEIVSR
ncbi:MAG: hypothetical protein P8X81_09185 [Woeseiaceae bacterium]